MSTRPDMPDSGGHLARPEDRRTFLRRIARGVAWSAPVISTLAAPSSAVAQVSDPGMMMWTICDWFPVLCRWLGGSEASSGAEQAPAPSPVREPPSVDLPEAPWSKPPPGG